MSPITNSSGKANIELLREALGKTLSDKHVEILLLYLSGKGAISQNKVDFEKLAEAMKTLFGAEVMLFFQINSRARKPAVRRLMYPGKTTECKCSALHYNVYDSALYRKLSTNPRIICW